MATLMKHGPAESIIAYYQKLWSKTQRERHPGEGNRSDVADGFPGGIVSTVQLNEALDLLLAKLTLIDIPVANLTDEAVEEINACITTSGRVSGLNDRLDEMLAAPDRAPRSF